MRIDPIQPTFLKRMFEHIVKRRIKLRNLHESNSRSKQTESRLPHNLMFHLRLGKHTRSSFPKTVVAKHQMLCSKKTSQPIRKIEAINRPRILFIFLPNILFTIKEFLEYENLSIQLPRKYPQPLIHRQSIIFVPHRISSCSTFRFSINITLLIFNKHILAANPRVQTSLIVYFFAYRYT